MFHRVWGLTLVIEYLGLLGSRRFIWGVLFIIKLWGCWYNFLLWNYILSHTECVYLTLRLLVRIPICGDVLFVKLWGCVTVGIVLSLTQCVCLFE